MKNKLPTIIFGLLFLPITVYILIWKSNANKKIKIALTAIWSIILICATNNSDSSSTPNRSIETNRNNTLVSTSITTVAKTTITSETTAITTTETKKTTTVTTEKISDNPLLNIKLTKADTGYGTKYGFITIKKSEMENITSAQLKEYVQKYGSDLNWLSIKYNDGTGLFLSTMKSTSTTYAEYGELDEQGAITKGIGAIEFDEDNFKIYHGDDNVFEQTDKKEFDINFFEQMAEPTPEVTEEEIIETEPVTEPEPEPEPVVIPEPEPEPVYEQEAQSTSYVLNTNTLKVHYSTCNDVKKIKPENYAECSDIQWAFDNGYTSCGHCHAK